MKYNFYDNKKAVVQSINWTENGIHQVHFFPEQRSSILGAFTLGFLALQFPFNSQQLLQQKLTMLVNSSGRAYRVKKRNNKLVVKAYHSHFFETCRYNCFEALYLLCHNAKLLVTWLFGTLFIRPTQSVIAYLLLF